MSAVNCNPVSTVFCTSGSVPLNLNQDLRSHRIDDGANVFEGIELL